jgi:hypothetical protein
MLAAIHKETGQFITVARLFNDLEWIGREKERFISPRGEVINWDKVGERDVEVIFVRESIDGKRAHFRIKDEVAISSNSGESDSHRKAKEGIYYALLNDEIKLSFGNREYFPSQLGIKDITLEEPTNNTLNAKILDVCLTLKDFHPVLGNGIAFEIQFSNQSIVVEEIRTYHRATDGFSCVWLKKGDFNGLDKLNNPLLEVTPYQKVLEEYNQKLELKQNKNLNLLGESINNKIRELERTNSKITLNLSSLFEKYLSVKDSIEGLLENLSLKYKKEIKEEVFIRLNKEIISDLKRDLNNQIKYETKDFEKIYSEQIKEKIRSYLEEKRVIQDFIKSTIELERDDLIIKIKEEALKELSPEKIKEELTSSMYSVWASFKTKTEEKARLYQSFVEGDIERMEFWLNEFKKKEIQGGNPWKKYISTQKKE